MKKIARSSELYFLDSKSLILINFFKKKKLIRIYQPLSHEIKLPKYKVLNFKQQKLKSFIGGQAIERAEKKREEEMKQGRSEERREVKRIQENRGRTNRGTVRKRRKE